MKMERKLGVAERRFWLVGTSIRGHLFPAYVFGRVRLQSPVLFLCVQ